MLFTFCYDLYDWLPFATYDQSAYSSDCSHRTSSACHALAFGLLIQLQATSTQPSTGKPGPAMALHSHHQEYSPSTTYDLCSSAKSSKSTTSSFHADISLAL